ncbi:TRAP transporter permease [uncultured Ferrovibrio sp.]|jgi:TRAP transporter 4TM/12TM fusion protein|uniref:TRAP transporter permease n=1 Tax=uncultured Ferrovibrio sp. TaxID=1576913 RepID=UPI00262C97C6|nr:TRAP transporter permease [uncultured Ferrovibrio sp.]
MADPSSAMMKTLNNKEPWPALLAGNLAALLSLFHLYTSFRGTLPTLQQVYVHLSFALVLIFLTRPVFGPESKFRSLRWVVDAPLVVASAAVGIYVVLNFMEISQRGAGDPSQAVIVLGIIATLIVLEGTRRILGWALPALAVIFIIYAFVGPYLPDLLAHRGFDIERLAATFYVSASGMAGTPLQVSATYVAIFVIFAAFLEVSGAGKFFIDWSYAALAWFRGGPAKVAILASSLMGTVSGSAVANTVATGTFTIPVMKRSGLHSNFAGAVEAAASSGGQIVPPVMGAAAFIMVEILGRPYSEVMVAAALPALLYYVALFFMVDFEVARQGIKGLPRNELPSAWKIFCTGWHLATPLIILILLLVVAQYTPFKAAFYAVLAVVAVSWISSSTRMGPAKLWDALKRGGNGMLEVAAACACAGITIGVLMLTGLALRLSGILIDFSGGNLFVLLVLTMAISIVLGMGLPTSAVYIVLAALVVPAMTTLGVDPLAAHMFVFYFGVMANVTPPVAIAAYAGAAIAKGDATKTGFIAFRLALSGFLLPFIWVYNPSLLLQGDTVEVITTMVGAVVGVIALSAAVQGYLFRAHATWYQRILLGVGAIALIKPGLTSDLLGAGLIAAAILSRFVFGAPAVAQRQTEEGA